MKFISYTYAGQASYGVVVADRIAPLSSVEVPDLKSFLALSAPRQGELIAAAQPTLAIADIQFAPVIPNPGKILCVGLNYEEHRKETGREKADHPAIFVRFADSQTGHNIPIALSSVSRSLDYEGELAVIIGKGGRHIAAEQAWDHVAGYACYNDATFRDWQRHTHQFTPGKNFPGSGAFGPWLVTSDEITDLGAKRLQTRLNGAVMQSATFSEMIFPIPEIIAYVSGFTPLSTGDVIATGTPGGVGFKRDPQVFMAEGDVVEVEIDGIGLLRNKIAAAV